MAKVLESNKYVYKYKHIDILDLFGIVLTLMIITTHVWAKYYEAVFGENRSFGYIAVEGFFLISGFFIARSATKDDAIPWHKYMLKKIKQFVPLLGFIFAISLFVFAISSSICLAPNIDCFAGMLVVGWYLYCIIFFGPIIYFFIKRWKWKASLVGLIISLSIYIGFYFWIGCITPTQFTADNFFTNAACIAVNDSLRSIAALFLGCAIFMLVIKLQKYNPHTFIRVIWSLVSLVSLAAIFYLSAKFSHTPFEFLSIFLFCIIYSVIFANLGFLTNIVKIGQRACSFISKTLLTTYLFHFTVYAFMFTFTWYDNSLWQTTWFLIINGVVCYCGTPIVSMGINKLYDLLMNKIRQKK